MQSIARQHSGAARRHPREAKRLTVLLLAAFASTAVAANQPTFTFALPGVSFGPLAVDAQGNGGRNSSANPAKPGVFQINVLAPANLAASPAALLVMKIGNATSAPIPVAIQ